MAFCVICFSHRRSPSPDPGITTLALVLLLAALTHGYSYKNCYRNDVQNTTVTCQNLPAGQLLDIVGDLHNDILHLEITQNNFRTVPRHGFANLSRLASLSMTANQIMQVDSGAFRGLIILSVLNLSSNGLKNLNLGTFHDLGNLTSLVLSNNSLSSFALGILRPLVRLQYLDISCNNFSNFGLVVEAIKDLTDLSVLVAKRNKMVVLEASGALPPRLYNLALSKNVITSLSFSTDFLAKVWKLDLSYNNISKLQNLTLLNLSSLLQLDVAGNPLRFEEVKNLMGYLHVVRNMSLGFLNLTHWETLTELCGQLQESVRYLKLEGNKFEKVSGSMEGCHRLTEMDMSQNGIRVPDLFTYGFPPASLRRLLLVNNKIHTLQFCRKGNGADVTGTCLPSLQYLSLQDNHLSTVQNGAFRGFSNLTNLTLTMNEINFIGKDAFQGLSQLRFLALSYNAIGEVFWETFASIPNLEHLKLRKNRMSVLNNSTFASLARLRILDLGGNNIKRMNKDSFVGLHSLKDLYLDGNHLESISLTFFQDLDGLEVLDLAGNFLQFTSWHLPDPPFVHLRNLRSLKLQGQQPHGLNLLPYNIFSKLQNLKELTISSNRFSTLGTTPFQELGNLTHLDMGDISNGDHILHNKTFQGLVSLRWLRMNNAGLGERQLRVLQGLQRLSTLLLTSNMIHIVPVGSVQALPSLQYLDLRYNVLMCTCRNAPFQKWAQDSPVQVILFHHYRCSGNSRMVETLAGFKATVCNADRGFLAFLCTTPALLCCLLVAAVYAKGKWYFKYGFYLLHAWLREAQLHHGKIKAHRYDAFVSYNCKDEAWVIKTLQPHLEEEGEPRFKLCLHQRDFEAGRPVVTNIVDAIYSSRKTICIVSRHYLTSEWCSMEVQVALYRLFEERRDVLLLIFLDDIPDQALSSYARMRRMVRKTTYLKWPMEPEARRLFWAKLREALRPPVTAAVAEGSPLVQDT